MEGRHRCGSANRLTAEDRRTGRTKGKEAAMKAHSTKRLGVSLTAVALSALSVPLAMLVATPAWPDAPRARPECTIVGTAGDDRLRGTRRDDVICALAGNDTVEGRGGDDRLILGPGRDSGEGGVGEDVIRGGAGWDDLGARGYPGNDRIFGGGGIDILVDWSGVDLLSGGPERDCLNAGDGEGGDVIRGGGGRDWFWADPRDRVFTAEVDQIACG
jgi:Ca2+-binding RTX toxin-like protein